MLSYFWADTYWFYKIRIWISFQSRTFMSSLASGLSWTWLSFWFFPIGVWRGRFAAVTAIKRQAVAQQNDQQKQNVKCSFQSRRNLFLLQQFSGCSTDLSTSIESTFTPNKRLPLIHFDYEKYYNTGFQRQNFRFRLPLAAFIFFQCGIAIDNGLFIDIIYDFRPILIQNKKAWNTPQKIVFCTETLSSKKW